MYVKKWLSLPKVDRLFFLIFDDYVKNKIGRFDFKDYYLPFINSNFTEILEFEMMEAFELNKAKHSYKTFNGKLVFVESDPDLLSINKYLLFIILDLFKFNLEIKIK